MTRPTLEEISEAAKILQVVVSDGIDVEIAYPSEKEAVAGVARWIDLLQRFSLSWEKESDGVLRVEGKGLLRFRVAPPKKEEK